MLKVITFWTKKTALIRNYQCYSILENNTSGLYTVQPAVTLTTYPKNYLTYSIEMKQNNIIQLTSRRKPICMFHVYGVFQKLIFTYSNFKVLKCQTRDPDVQGVLSPHLTVTSLGYPRPCCLQSLKCYVWCFCSSWK